MATHPFEQDFLRRYRANHEAGILLGRQEGTSFILCVHRDLAKGAHTPDELGFLEELMKRLANAAVLALRMKMGHAIQTADRLAANDGAVALLTQSGFSLFHSAGFDRLLGDAIELRQGRVSAVHPASNDRLQDAILRASAWSTGQPTHTPPVVLRRKLGRPLVARLHPVAGAARDFLGLAKTILTIDDLDQAPRPPDPKLLVDGFHLTVAEARLACRLGQAATLREAADAERISYESARTRLKTIFDKTGVNSQSALALLVSRMA